jgi:hypothetical protein
MSKPAKFALEVFFAYDVLVSYAKRGQKTTYKDLYGAMAPEFGWPAWKRGHKWFQRCGKAGHTKTLIDRAPQQLTAKTADLTRATDPNPANACEKLARRDFIANASCRGAHLCSPVRPNTRGSICWKSAVGEL